MRTVVWISPIVGGHISEEDKKHSSDEWPKENIQAQYWYTEGEKKKFREDPQAHFEYRQKFEPGFNAAFDMFIANQRNRNRPRS